MGGWSYFIKDIWTHVGSSERLFVKLLFIYLLFFVLKRYIKTLFLGNYSVFLNFKLMNVTEQTWYTNKHGNVHVRCFKFIHQKILLQIIGFNVLLALGKRHRVCLSKSFNNSKIQSLVEFCFEVYSTKCFRKSEKKYFLMIKFEVAYPFRAYSKFKCHACSMYE